MLFLKKNFKRKYVRFGSNYIWKNKAVITVKL